MEQYSAEDSDDEVWHDTADQVAAEQVESQKSDLPAPDSAAGVKRYATVSTAGGTRVARREASRFGTAWAVSPGGSQRVKEAAGVDLTKTSIASVDSSADPISSSVSSLPGSVDMRPTTSSLARLHGLGLLQSIVPPPLYSPDRPRIDYDALSPIGSAMNDHPVLEQAIKEPDARGRLGVDGLAAGDSQPLSTAADLQRHTSSPARVQSARFMGHRHTHSAAPNMMQAQMHDGDTEVAYRERSVTSTATSQRSDQTLIWSPNVVRAQTTGHSRSQSNANASHALMSVSGWPDEADDSLSALDRSTLRRHQSLTTARPRDRRFVGRTSSPLASPALEGTEPDRRTRRLSFNQDDDILASFRGQAPSSTRLSPNIGTNGFHSPTIRSPLERAGSFKSPWSPTAEEAVRLGAQRAYGTSSPGHSPISSPVAPGTWDSMPRAAHVSTELQDVQAKIRDWTLEAESPAQTRVHPSSGLLDVPAIISRSRQPPRSPLAQASVQDEDDIPSLQPVQQPERRSTPLLAPLDTTASVLGQSEPRKTVGPYSAAASVPPIGHRQSSLQSSLPEHTEPSQLKRGGFTAAPGVGQNAWLRERQRVVSRDSEQGSLYMDGNNSATRRNSGYASGMPADWQPSHSPYEQWAEQTMQPQPRPMLPMQSINGHTHERHPSKNDFAAASHLVHPGETQLSGVSFASEIAALIASKNYNPMSFDTKPQRARFFVIKSYTEEDVYKSLKHEIWSSTELGNQRLDRAYREACADGPVYLFYSVNGSGHFCGVAEMLTRVDPTVSSSVWAQDKWKGLMRVRWIYVRDIPNSALRHIKLTNTAEQKAVTSSRDTQEVPFAQGLEMLDMFATYPSRTSLLQDYSYYEMHQLQRGLVTSAQTAPRRAVPQQAQYYPTPPPARYQPPTTAYIPVASHYPQQHQRHPQNTGFVVQRNRPVAAGGRYPGA
ncbi:uncharacterized protein L969DRAFT_102407 [Mixia osmundae IAM 14324]|uniref:YTH domain-containing protein n=1 Tax=Mixia osmundae (strain CBS 9802 / IAM 14324 / JCM 22182 / KY 12970) TaxID=764103 RepID=G7DU39_MIXOS|nr:uncharacterized protein L969DRAFT_102407 [Mixia osmundae IAM 14324]KEI40966.1 hypothetical protein L969DRAFT_102407 [Mixia osmundae IAM 14324]GAA94099.1 hypothetical protein E5Q_00746 [Mixia osmundae IAM 14324]